MFLAPPTNVKLDWCTHEAATYAVKHWHYSRRMPKSKLAKIGVWENGEFIGVIIFGNGATGDLVKRFGLRSEQGCELVRVALRPHRTPVSRMIAISLKMLKKTFPGLRLVVSFADPAHGHTGGVYQAGNWIYTGKSTASEEYMVNGKRWHGRALRNGKPSFLTTKEFAGMRDPRFQVVLGSSKYRYLMPLDDEMWRAVELLRKPYPKRATSVASDTPTFRVGEGGASPTVALVK